MLSQETVKQRHNVKKRVQVISDGQKGYHSDTGKQLSHSGHSDGSHDSPRASENKDDLNISPITQASCADSPQALSNASGSPITPQDTVKDNEAKFRPFSTPTEEIESGPVCTPYGKTAVFRDYGNMPKGEKVRFQNDSLENFGENKLEKDSKTQTQSSKSSNDLYPKVHKKSKELSSHMSSNNDTLKDSLCAESHRSIGPGFQESGMQHRNLSAESGNNSHHSETNTSGGSSVSEDGKSSPRCKYCWVTRHMSCDECPVNWSHVVKTAERVAEKGISDVSEGKGH